MPDLQILYEDNHLLIVNKPAGMLVQGDSTGDTPLSELVERYLIDKYDKPGRAFVGVTPVSYTHLDVYKRQDADRSKRMQRAEKRHAV